MKKKDNNKYGVTMKKLKVLLLMFLLLPCFLFGCSLPTNEVYVSDIVKGETIGDITTYIIKYSDGTKAHFSVENGKDGVDGENLTLDVVKEYCEEKGITLDEYFHRMSVSIDPIKQATNYALRSAVSIYTEDVYSMNKNYKVMYAGAGVIYKMTDEYSYIITNYHVVASENSASGLMDEITIFQYGANISIGGVGGYIQSGDSKLYSDYSYGDDAISATCIGGTEDFDLAVLKVPTSKLKSFNPNACPADVAEDYDVADTAIAIGNPKGFGVSVTSGIVSVESETIQYDNTSPELRVMRIDTAINGGNSGGGVFNSKGELIGIVNAKIEDSSIDNMAYALPIDCVYKVADNLIYYYETSSNFATIKRPLLNINYYTENSRAVYNPEDNTTKIYDDLVIHSVDNGGIGHTLGLNTDYIITSIYINNDEHKINRSFELPDWLLTVRVGDKIAIGFLDASKNASVTPEITILASHLQ